MGRVYTTDVGTKIKLDTGQDLSSGVGSHKIVAKLKVGAAVDLTTTVEETTKLQHVKTAATLDSQGTWNLQAHVEFTDGSEYRGEAVELPVYPPIT